MYSGITLLHARRAKSRTASGVLGPGALQTSPQVPLMIVIVPDHDTDWGLNEGAGPGPPPTRVINGTPNVDRMNFNDSGRVRASPVPSSKYPPDAGQDPAVCSSPPYSIGLFAMNWI